MLYIAQNLMTTILKQFGTDYGEINLTEHLEGLRYWVTLTLYTDQTDMPYVLCMTDDLESAESVYYQAVERFAKY
jgi:hypothetical protein